MSNFRNFKYDGESLKFEIFDVDVSYSNAIRRTIIGDVQTIAFKTEYGKDSDIIIEKNTSALHNEFLSHRISLVPIHYDPELIDDYKRDSLEFVIDMENNTNNTIDVTSEHIDIIDRTKNPPIKLDKKIIRKMFPPNQITGDFILINRLKPSKGGIVSEGECIKLKAYASVGSGKMHASYCPTCVAVSVYKEDNASDRKASDLQEFIKKNSANDNSIPIEKLTRTFNINESHKYYFTNEHGEPNVFDFTIESDGRIPPNLILLKSMDILASKVKNLSKTIENSELTRIIPSDSIMNAFDIILLDEDYTVGYIIQSYMYKYFQDVDEPIIKYISSNVPHPLENKLVLRVCLHKSNNKNTIIKLINETCTNIHQLIVKNKIEIISVLKK